MCASKECCEQGSSPYRVAFDGFRTTIALNTFAGCRMASKKKPSLTIYRRTSDASSTTLLISSQLSNPIFCAFNLFVKFKFCELFAYPNYIPLARRNQAPLATPFLRPSISGFWPMIEVAGFLFVSVSIYVPFQKPFFRHLL